MAITIRELPPDQWDRLKGLPGLDGGPPPEDTATLIVAEDEGQIVAYWFALTVVHLEPIWITEQYRKGSLGLRMWGAMKQILDAYRIRVAFCFSQTSRPETATYLERLGFQILPYLTYLYGVLPCQVPSSEPVPASPSTNSSVAEGSATPNPS